MHISELRAIVDASIARGEARDRIADVRNLEMAQNLVDMRAETRSEIRELRGQMSSLKTTIVVTGIASVLTVIFGVAGINAALLSNMLASFESGKSAAATHAELKQQGEETATLVRQIQRQLQQPAPATK